VSTDRPAQSGDGLSVLFETIAAEARSEAEALLREARSRAERLVEEAQAKARVVLDVATAAGTAEGERERRRRVAVAQIESRRASLAERDALVERAIEGAARRFAEALDAPDGAQLLVGLVVTAARSLGDPRLVVRVRPKDRALIPRRISGVDAELVLDDRPLDEPGAVVTTSDGHRSVRVTLSGLLHRCRDELRSAAARSLFGEGSAR
jgi:V/A-type H+/Na+-transporting ATPase subunit E